MIQEKYSLCRYSDYIYLPKRLGHKILVFNFQAWDISDIVSAMQRLEFPCLKYQSPR